MPLADEKKVVFLQPKHRKNRNNMKKFFFVVLVAGTLIIAGVYMLFAKRPTESESEKRKLTEKPKISFVSLLTGAGFIAAWVLVIVARVKCKDTFSKVLLIVYLVLLGLEIIAVILFIVACAYLVSSCNF